MRGIAIGLAALALAACGQPRSQQAEGCVLGAAHELIWTDASAPDIVTAQAQGPSCAQAMLTLEIRNARGASLWAFTTAYADLVAGGGGPEAAPPVSAAEMDAFLAGWADLSAMRSSELPAWREGEASPTDSVQNFSYRTPLTRAEYEHLRTRGLAMLCYAAATETSACLIADPASGAPVVIASFGPSAFRASREN